MHPESQAIDWKALEPRGLYARWGKPGLDLALLVLCAPLALLLMSAIALVNLCVFRDAREVFFLQQRAGRHGRPFRLIKFRTMRAARQGEFHAWGSGQDALRVTRFGRWLRNTHLDELPQIINVLRGDMSFVGPRPEMLEVERWAEREVPGFGARLVVKPGLTGWAQITQGYAGQDAQAYARKLALNTHYLAHLSLATDLEVLARTAVWMLRGRGWDWQASACRAAAPDAPRADVLLPNPRARRGTAASARAARSRR